MDIQNIPQEEPKHKTITLVELSALAIVIVVGFAWYLSNNTPTPNRSSAAENTVSESPSSMTSTSVIPSSSPSTNTNPINNVYKNPFE